MREKSESPPGLTESGIRAKLRLTDGVRSDMNTPRSLAQICAGQCRRSILAFAYVHCAGCLLVVVLCCRTILAQQPQPLPIPTVCSQGPPGPPPCKDSDGDGLCDSWELAKRLPDGTPLPDADPDWPDIYVHYDYMGWGQPGAACAVDADCTNGGATPNYVCHLGRCNHNHKPDPEALQLVMDAFARHSVALHIDSNPHEVPHSDVITFSRPGDGTNGATAACAGADIQAGQLGAFAVSFFDIKDRFFDPKQALAYHYAVFIHFATCLQDANPNAPGYCGACPNDRATPPGRPTSGISGTSELPGNDFIVSLGARYFVANEPSNIIDQAGVFMHELGHNLGLHHDGDNANQEYAPNYLSVMNLNYVFTGIAEAEAVSPTPLMKSCSNDGDCQAGNFCYHQRDLPANFPGGCVRIDYSTSKLNTISEFALDETVGLSPTDAGLRDMVFFFDGFGGNGVGTASGPIWWSGSAPVSCTTDIGCGGGGALTGRCLPSRSCEVRADLNLLNGITETFPGYNDWDHGSCRTSADCPINGIRFTYHDTIDPTLDPHEPCVQNKCQTLWYAFQCTKWGKQD